MVIRPLDDPTMMCVLNLWSPMYGPSVWGKWASGLRFGYMVTSYILQVMCIRKT